MNLMEREETILLLKTMEECCKIKFQTDRSQLSSSLHLLNILVLLLGLGTFGKINIVELITIHLPTLQMDQEEIPISLLTQEACILQNGEMV
mgnify:CR=1 FL=1|jgi:hypothetical protein